MADFTFDVDQNLGAVVLPRYKVFCNWSPKTPISDAYKVTRDVCGHKFSAICGFTFKSSLDAPYFILHPELKLSLGNGISDTAFHPTFQVVYVPKSRSTHARNDKALSGWYLWQHIAVDNKQIMSSKDFFAYYGFDVAKFFQSDVFKRYLPLFIKQIQAAYDTAVKEFIDNFGTEDQYGYTKRDCMFFSKCVVDSLQKIDDVLKTNWESPEEKKAKLAYNADDTYSLNAKSNHNLGQVSGVNPTGTAMKAEESEVAETEFSDMKANGFTAETGTDLASALDSLDVDVLRLPLKLEDAIGLKHYKIDGLGKSEDGKSLLMRLQLLAEDWYAESDSLVSEGSSRDEHAKDMWEKAQKAMVPALRAYNDLADYCKLIADAYDNDSMSIDNDDPMMQETKKDIDNAIAALNQLRKALHFD